MLKKISISAICSSKCQHGSTCIAPNTCNCTAGYNGSICQYRMSLSLASLMFIINLCFFSNLSFALSKWWYLCKFDFWIFFCLVLTNNSKVCRRRHHRIVHARLRTKVQHAQNVSRLNPI